MPTYDYSCPDCGYDFQRFHSMTKDPIKLCPECGNENVKRLIGAGGGLIFKGGGFFVTENRSDDYKSKTLDELKSSETKESSKEDS